MPEGPEIRRLADALQKQIAGRVIDSIRFGLEPLKQWEQCLTGVKITKVETYGKAMVTRFDNDLNINNHNQLYGRWIFFATRTNTRTVAGQICFCCPLCQLLT